MNVENVLELLESLKRQHKSTGEGGIVLHRNGTTTERGDEETAEKMVGQMLQFQQASPLVNVALGLMGVQTPLVCDTVSRFLVDSLASVLRVRNFSAFELQQITQKFEMLVASGQTNGALVLELVEIFLKAATAMSSYLQQPSPRSVVYVRSRISTAEDGVSDAAWAAQGILNTCLKNKEEIYNKLSPFARLHVWRLWPYLFKHDISVLARHAMQQPSGSVKAELQSCGAFSSMVASLALAPDLLAEARHLLHSWFLSVNRTAAQLMELRTELADAVRSITSDPVPRDLLCCLEGKESQQ
ncbi:hypothetical protein CY35_03G023800 [Sphagnum magellanicum]|nr:hypothetical protein CY35_03G023800 [Sphagnum magellanicum]